MIRKCLLFVLAAATGSMGCAPTGTDGSGSKAGELIPADVVVSWNDRLLSVAEAEDGFLTLKGVRAAAMMHLAMHDALSALDARFRPFRLSDLHVDADPVGAVTEAAFAVAVSQYPDQEPAFAAERARWRGAAVSASSDDAAGSIGERAAAAVLEARREDGWNSDPEYQWHPMGPGVYAEFNEHSGTPDGFVFGAGWAVARPFMLESPGQFRSPPPPDIQSDAYTRDFNEVRTVGSQQSILRSADQTHFAMWWKEFVEESHNRLARELVEAEGMGLWETARLFALLNMSIYDGYVASFDGKFVYNHWRPFTAIRWASNDGNPDTDEDPLWTNLHDHTYAFPSYPSAHGTVCAAAMTVLENVFGSNRPFHMTIREVDSAGPMSPKVAMEPVTRTFESFSQAAEECSLSRIYLGIHFRYDSEAGTTLGRQIGELAVRNFLGPR